MTPLLAETQLTLSVGLVAAFAIGGLVFAALGKAQVGLILLSIAVVFTLFR